MKNKRAIRRDLIAANMNELQRYGKLSETRTFTGKRGPAAKAYYLNRDQALLVCLFSRTEKAANV